MQIDYPHHLSHQEARARLQALGEYLQNRHGIQVTWEGDRAGFRGKYLVVNIRGELTFGDGVVHFRGEDPGFLWRRRAVQYMQHKLSRYLDPTVPLHELPRGAPR